MKTILVTGDLVWDTHVARLPWKMRGYHQPHCQTQLKHRHGGAWYLRDMIESALRAEVALLDARVKSAKAALSKAREDPATQKEDVQLHALHVKRLDAETEARKERLAAHLLEPWRAGHESIEENKGPCGIAKGCSVWEWFEDDGPSRAGTWRIKEFLGCQEPEWPPVSTRKPCQQVIDGSIVQPDVLVLDDLNLGFAASPVAWPACLNDPRKGPVSIIAKSSIAFDSPLWADKLLKPAWAGRVTVVMAAAALRDMGARLSRDLSWDRTIEDVQEAFAEGGVAWRLRHCRRVVVTFGRGAAAVFSCDPQSPADGRGRRRLEFERLVFDPAQLESTPGDSARGGVFGASSAMTAALVVREIDTLPLKGGRVVAASSHLAVSRGLMADRELYLLGGGHEPGSIKIERRDPDREGEESIEDIAWTNVLRATPERRFASAYNRALLDRPRSKEATEGLSPTLLTDAVGTGAEFLSVAAQEIVRFGWKRMLKSVPRLECGKFLTVDREEIERLNAVRRLIQDYQDNKEDTRPLSIAVFGQPGSGKSFAIKQLAEALFGRSKAVLEFNLSQFDGHDALHEAFHQVRDKSVQGRLPFVFWDEFDSPRGQDGELGWLKEFLAPMQDSKFVGNGVEHPFGKCIFIFAGGTCATYEEFQSRADHRRQQKGPDFVSRLRGFVNIKGPNSAGKEGDPVHVVRRALLLRSLLERYHQGVISRENGEVMIDPAVLAAFLEAGSYHHGARSMESIVSLCRLHESRILGPSELPPAEVVQLHVSNDFTETLNDRKRVHFGAGDIERLAEIMHERWMSKKKGYRRGIMRNDDAQEGPLTHPLIMSYGELGPEEKEGNRRPARLTLLRLSSLEYDVRRRGEGGAGIPRKVAISSVRRIIARSEHRRWMSEKLLDGVAWSPQTCDGFLLHKDLRALTGLSMPEKELDMAIAEAIGQFLEERGFVMVKQSAPKRAARS